MTENEIAQTIAEVLSTEFETADEVDNLEPVELAKAAARALYNRAKADTLQQALTTGPVLVTFDPRAEGVQLPAEYKTGHQLSVRVGYNLLPPIHLEIGPPALVATLSFNKRPAVVIIPWSCVYAMRSEGTGAMAGIWVDSAPIEVFTTPKQAEPTPAKAPTPAPTRPKLGLVPEHTDEYIGSACGPSGLSVDEDASGRAFLKAREADATKPEPVSGSDVTTSGNQDGIDRSRYVYEGPNGTPRDRRDYSPDEKLRTTVGERLDAAGRRVVDLPGGHRAHIRPGALAHMDGFDSEQRPLKTTSIGLVEHPPDPLCVVRDDTKEST